MKIIFGLGNPGVKYEKTRHNVGFMALDFYLKDIQAISCQSKFKSQICEVHFGSTKVFFAKPQTFMNESGAAVKELVEFYKLDYTKDILVIHDDVDLPLGTIRTTGSSSAAGQNGIKSIIDALGSQDFHRIRVGVESRASRADMETANFVLQQFTADQLKELDAKIFPEIKLKIEGFINS